MNFYHDLITAKSWQVLLKLRQNYNFVLIGGWAVFLYTHALKSKDIDLMIGYEDLEKLRKEYDVVKNERLKKYEARDGEAEIDIYVPFYSNPGLPAQDLGKYVVEIEGFRVVEKEVLAFLKQRGLEARSGTAKGRKDLIDLISLFELSDFDFERYKEVAIIYSLKNNLQFTHKVISGTITIDELGFNRHKLARLKRKILPFLKI